MQLFGHHSEVLAQHKAKAIKMIYEFGFSNKK